MARPLRIQFTGAWYHVMHRGANCQAIYLDDQDKRHFINIFTEIVIIYGVEIHAYCLMDNHYHFVIHTPRGNLSEAMRFLNSKYTQIFNLRHSRDGALFRGRYKAILISAQDYLISVSRYIHLNPVEAGIVKNPLQYKWSSYKYYLGCNACPDWLTTLEIKKRFGKRCFKQQYRKYVENSSASENQDLYNSPHWIPVLGSKEFCEQILEKLKSESLSAEIVGKDRILQRPSMKEIIDAVAAYFHIDPVFLVKKAKRRVLSPARNIAIFLCRKAGGMKLREIGNNLGELAYSSVSNRVKKVENDANLNKIAVSLLIDLRSKCRTLEEVEHARASEINQGR